MKWIIYDLPVFKRYRDKTLTIVILFVFFQVKGLFPDQKYMIRTEQVYPGMKVDQSSLSSRIQDFCKDMEIKSIVHMTSHEMEKSIKQELDGK